MLLNNLNSRQLITRIPHYRTSLDQEMKGSVRLAMSATALHTLVTSWKIDSVFNSTVSMLCLNVSATRHKTPIGAEV